MTKVKKSSTVEVLDDPLADLWAEIDTVTPKYETPRETDITREMYAAHHNISIQSADDRMDKLVKTGKWKLVRVKGGNGDRPRTVLRKIKSE